MRRRRTCLTLPSGSPSRAASAARSYSQRRCAPKRHGARVTAQCTRRRIAAASALTVRARACACLRRPDGGHACDAPGPQPQLLRRRARARAALTHPRARAPGDARGARRATRLRCAGTRAGVRIFARRGSAGTAFGPAPLRASRRPLSIRACAASRAPPPPASWLRRTQRRCAARTCEPLPGLTVPRAALPVRRSVPSLPGRSSRRTSGVKWRTCDPGARGDQPSWRR